MSLTHASGRKQLRILDFEPVTGHEQGGARRALVVSYEPFHRADRVSVCPITAARSVPRYPNEVAISVGEGGQTRPGVILCHQVRVDGNTNEIPVAQALLP